MSVADNADWGRTVETAACERRPREHVAADDDEPDWFDARFVAPFAPSDSVEVIGVFRYPKDFVERVADRNHPALAPPVNLLDASKAVEASVETDGAAFPSDAFWLTVTFEAAPATTSVASRVRELSRGAS